MDPQRNPKCGSLNPFFLLRVHVPESFKPKWTHQDTTHRRSSRVAWIGPSRSTCTLIVRAAYTVIRNHRYHTYISTPTTMQSMHSRPRRERDASVLRPYPLHSRCAVQARPYEHEPLLIARKAMMDVSSICLLAEE